MCLFKYLQFCFSLWCFKSEHVEIITPQDLSQFWVLFTNTALVFSTISATQLVTAFRFQQPQTGALSKKPFTSKVGLSQGSSGRIFNRSASGRAGAGGVALGGSAPRAAEAPPALAVYSRRAMTSYARQAPPATNARPRQRPRDNTLWTRPDDKTKLNKFDKSCSYLDHYIDGRTQWYYFFSTKL